MTNERYLILFLIISIISINKVNANELKSIDITNDIEIKYKWYKENISEEGTYYPLRKIKNEDIYDKNNYKFVKLTSISEEACSYSNEFYLISPKKFKKYRKTHDAKIVVIENIEPETNVEIHYENRVLNFDIISHENKVMVINLKSEFLCDRLMFYIDTNNKYKISLYRDAKLEQIILAKELENQKISIPDSTWKLAETIMHKTGYTEREYVTSTLTEIIGQITMCEVSEKYVYKYNYTKEYYDDEYHTYVEGYIKDEQDYRIYYNQEPIVITNVIEIPKETIVEVPKIEYIYIEKELEIEEKEPTQECPKEIHTNIETQIIERKIKIIPTKVYIVITILFLIIISLIIKNIVKKNRIN